MPHVIPLRMRADMAEPSAPAVAPAGETVPCAMREFLLYFLSLGTFGFGGPIALAGYMQRDLVERRRWISKQDYLEGLALAQLAPGPLAAQLAIYLGWVRARVLGATLVALAFVAPSLVMVLAISALYVAYGGLPWMQGLFYGIGAAVIAIIARSAVKLVKMTLARDWLLWAIFAISALVTGWTESEIVWVFLLSGVVAMLVRTPFWRGASTLAIFPTQWLLAGLDGPATIPVLLKILWFFTGAGAVVFGSGLAIVPFLHGGVVNDFHWLDERQFLDAVAVAMISPGPVLIIATATASRNCRSSSQWKSLTTPPCRKGTIARPLPNTTAPAPVKNQRIFNRTGMVAGPSRPASSHCVGKIARVEAPRQNGVRTSMATTPESRKTHTISLSVQPVTSALMAKIAHRSQSRARVILTSFTALRAMIAMTAAPIP